MDVQRNHMVVKVDFGCANIDFGCTSTKKLYGYTK